MSAKTEQKLLAERYAIRCNEIFSKEVIDEEESVELQTLCALAIELIKHSSPSVVREAGRTVEIRYRIKL